MTHLEGSFIVQWMRARNMESDYLLQNPGLTFTNHVTQGKLLSIFNWRK